MITAPTFERYQSNATNTAAAQSSLAENLHSRTSSSQLPKSGTLQMNYQGVVLSGGRNTGSLLDFYSELVGFEVDEDEDPISGYASEVAVYVVERAFDYLQRRWTNPRITTDGAGGLRMTWRVGDGEIRAIIPGTPVEIQYLYFEQGAEHYVVKNFTSMTLCEKFDSLQKR